MILGTLSFGQFMSVTSICSLDLAYDCKYHRSISLGTLLPGNRLIVLTVFVVRSNLNSS